MLLELYDARRREFPAFVSEGCWVTSYMLVGLMGYLIHEWRHYVIVATVLPLMGVSYIWWV